MFALLPNDELLAAMVDDCAKAEKLRPGSFLNKFGELDELSAGALATRLAKLTSAAGNVVFSFESAALGVLSMVDGTLPKIGVFVDVSDGRANVNLDVVTPGCPVLEFVLKILPPKVGSCAAFWPNNDPDPNKGFDTSNLYAIRKKEKISLFYLLSMNFILFGHGPCDSDTDLFAPPKIEVLVGNTDAGDAVVLEPTLININKICLYALNAQTEKLV